MAYTESNSFNMSSPKKKDADVFTEVRLHWERGFNETMRRATGRNRIGTTSFDEADELFRCWLDENAWPYDALIFDPRIFTMIFEKTSRLIANKPRAKLIPREGGDVLMSKINNMLLDFQWDQAKNGGTMLSKWAMMDMNCRKYGASFGLSKWRYEKDDKGNVVFDGPDFKVLNNRDCAQDLSATSIENCNWFQVREYVTFHELERVNDTNRSNPIYKNLDRLHEAISQDTKAGGDTRGINWTSRNRQISRIEIDPIGKDPAFKTIEIITEYRKDRWITFSPRHGVILRDIPNPYQNYELPIIMLRYYAIDDDLYGLSEIEPIKGLQKGINALLCQYVDEINQHLYSPIAIGPGVREYTLEWGKGSRWKMNNPNTDFRLVETKSNAAAYFNNTYSVLVAAMMNALGESSLGVNNTQPYSKDKTATEVQALNMQRNARDNFNQLCLAESMERQLMLWHSMNQLLLLTDPKQPYYVLRVVGKEFLQDFIDLGLGDDILPDEAVMTMAEQKITDPTSFMRPKHPVTLSSKEGPKEVKKLELNDNGELGFIYVSREDLEGMYDFQVDIESMQANSDDQRKQARQTAISLLVTNPNVSALLMQDGVKPKFKELMVSWLEELGWYDADRYFENAPQQGMPGQPGAMPGQPGTPGGTPDQAQGGLGQPGAQPQAPQAPQGQQPPQGPGAQLVQPMGYFNYAPPNSLMGVPAWIEQRYAAKQGTQNTPGANQGGYA